MTEFRMYSSTPYPDETHGDFMLRLLRVGRYSSSARRLTEEQHEWLIKNSVRFYFEKRKLDEYLIIEDDVDANAFRLTFNV